MVTGIISKCKNVTYGVQQGSTLGPLLFLLFLDDVINLDVQSKCVLYADDIVLYCDNTNVNSNLTTLSNDMSKIFEWSNQSRLTINLSKTKIVHFGKKGHTLL